MAILPFTVHGEVDGHVHLWAGCQHAKAVRIGLLVSVARAYELAQLCSVGDYVAESYRRCEVPGSGRNDWYSIDCHVHTPASADYRGSRIGDDAYYEWLECIQASDLDIVVVADHNTVDGYRKLMSMQKRLFETIDMLEQDEQEVPPLYRERAELFEGVTLLPAVEVDIYPSLHFLAIFDPSALGSTDEFLAKAGFPPNTRGSAPSSIEALLRLEDLYEVADDLGCLIVAAHADRDKGIYQAGRDWGKARVSAICDVRLAALEYTSESTRGQLESLLRDDPMWKRDEPLAFVRSSDCHFADDQTVGERRSWIRINGYDSSQRSAFRGLCEAFKNPAELVSAQGRPEIAAIRKNLEGLPFVESHDDPSQVEGLLRLACAFGNSQSGTVVVGRNSHGNWTGVKNRDEQVFERELTDVLIRGLSGCPPFRIRVYQNDEKTLFATVSVSRSVEVCSVTQSGIVWIMEGSDPTSATSRQIVRLAEDALLERFSPLSSTRHVAEHARKLAGVHDSLDVIPLFRKLADQTGFLMDVFEMPEEGSVLPESLVDTIRPPDNGYSRGDLAILSSVPHREPTHYTRFSVPLGRRDHEDPRLESVPVFDGRKLILGDNGVVFFDASDRVAILSSSRTPLVLRPRSEDISLEFLLGFFKSAVYAWFVCRCLQDQTRWHPLILAYSLPVPAESGKKEVTAVSDIVREVLAIETRYLDATEELRGQDNKKMDRFDEQIEELRESHNSSVAPLMKKLDQLMFRYFSFSDLERKLVRDVLKANDIAMFDDLATSR